MGRRVGAAHPPVDWKKRDTGTSLARAVMRLFEGVQLAFGPNCRHKVRLSDLKIVAMPLKTSE